MDLSQIVEQDWNEARRRVTVVRPLLEERCSRERARIAATELGLSERQIYRLIRRLRAGGGELTSLLPGGSNGGQGKRRLAGPREQLLRRLIDEIFLTRQRRTAADLVQEIRIQALKAGMPPLPIAPFAGASCHYPWRKNVNVVRHILKPCRFTAPRQHLISLWNGCK